MPSIKNSTAPMAAIDAESLRAAASMLDSLPELKPLPTGVKPSFRPDPAIKAVVFDIYGTLLASSTGDIDGFSLESRSLEAAFDDFSGSDDARVDHKAILSIYKPTVQQSLRDAKNRGVEHPEIDVIAIWRRIVERAVARGWLPPDRAIDCRRLAFVFELLSNQVHPMPGMGDVIHRLGQAGLPLGIISNAQFYTPIIMNHFLDNRFVEGERVAGFEEALTLFSYQLRRAKPDSSLFKRVAEGLTRRFNLAPDETLYVGNDMYKDIWPASLVGFKTALFAGDQRSLRLREDKPEINGLQPDFVVTELNHVTQIAIPS